MLSATELAARRLTIKNAIATQRLEGLTVDPETTADLEAWARGDIDLDTARKRAVARIEARKDASETEPSLDWKDTQASGG
jgi:hypothetical protein